MNVFATMQAFRCNSVYGESIAFVISTFRGENSMPLAAPIPQDRPLTDQEAELVRWLLENGKPDAASFLTQLPLARVVTQCDCGCASINFAIARVLPPVGAGMLILADYSWEATDRLALGVFVFSCGGLLAGLEVWSAGEMYVPPSLPAIEVLRSLVVS